MTRSNLTHRMKQLLVLLAAASLLAGCSTYSKVREVAPGYTPSSPSDPAASRIVSALGLQRHKPMESLADYLTVARDSLAVLQRHPGDQTALRDYNFAVARIVTAVQKIDPSFGPITVPSEGGNFTVAVRPDRRPNWQPSLYRFTPADQFDVRGSYVKNRTTRPGLGAPVVAVGREKNDTAAHHFRMLRTYYGVTVVARFEGRRCELSFEDPLASEETRVGRREFPLAADFTVPVAVMLAEMEPKKLEITRLIWPEKYAETARLVAMQPYDPTKTIILVVHGLMDTQATWAPMMNALRGDPEIRKNYQFWFYSYPSGYPYPYSALLLRRELDALRKAHGVVKPIVLIGHSMGGCISRLLITDAGQNLWKSLFNQPPQKAALSEKSRKLLTESLIFSHRPEVGRVIFIAAPLKGSDLSTNILGRIGSSLVRSPSTLLQVGKDIRNVLALHPGELKLRRAPNSVDTLAPNNKFVLAINKIPITRGIPYHTIIGDRGRGDSPNSSDGVVPYWSSHMEGAESECIVPSGHPAHQDPKAIEEVRRILLLHAD